VHVIHCLKGALCHCRVPQVVVQVMKPEHIGMIYPWHWDSVIKQHACDIVHSHGVSALTGPVHPRDSDVRSRQADSLGGEGRHDGREAMSGLCCTRCAGASCTRLQVFGLLSPRSHLPRLLH
jgi:hypothetical protein